MVSAQNKFGPLIFSIQAFSKGRDGVVLAHVRVTARKLHLHAKWQRMCHKESRIPRRKPLILRARLVRFSSRQNHRLSAQFCELPDECEVPQGYNLCQS